MKARRRTVGASPRRVRTSWSSWWSRGLRWVGALVSGGVLLGLAALASGILQGILQQPVSRVLFTGEINNVYREDLVREVAPLLDETGFVRVRLSDIRQVLLDLPWVEQVEVTRSWPDELVVHITEQRPIAVWGDDALLNHRGEIFRPGDLGDTSGLPALRGPDFQAARVVDLFGAMSVLLSEQELRLISLSTDPRGGWTASLEGGVELNLGRDEVMRQMQRFLLAYRVELRQRFDRIAYVDLRHDNGLAVGWRKPFASDRAAANFSAAGSGSGSRG